MADCAVLVSDPWPDNHTEQVHIYVQKSQEEAGGGTLVWLSPCRVILPFPLSLPTNTHALWQKLYKKKKKKVPTQAF